MNTASTILRAPLDARSRREAAYLAATLLPAIPAFALVLVGLAATFLSLVGVGLPVLAGALALARLTSALFRGPARATVGWEWSSPAPRRSRGVVRRVGEVLRDGDAWRSLLYCGVKLLLTAIGVYGALVGYVVGALGLTFPVWWFAARGAFGLFDDRAWIDTWPLAVQGGALLLVAPWFVRLVVAVDHVLVERLLAPSTTRARIAALEASRTTLAEVATATLRRVERDLHDGTQARLVALGVTLSRLEPRLTDPQDQEIIAAARQQVLDLLGELREIIGGVHPPALDDGLPTALATLAARSPVPTALHDELRCRPTDAQASALYFTAAELLTNVARHAHAEHARLEISNTANDIVLVVRDDGHGGANLTTHGTGLTGIERRVRALDGTITVDSPPEGPTTVAVTMPKEPRCG